MPKSKQRDSDETWVEFWKEICTDDYGNVRLEQVKKELADYYFILQQVPKVYDHITGGMLSKPNYYAGDVIEKAKEHFQQQMEYFKEEEMELEREDIVERIESVMQTEGTDINRVSIPKREWEEIKNEILGQR